MFDSTCNNTQRNDIDKAILEGTAYEIWPNVYK